MSSLPVINSDTILGLLIVGIGGILVRWLDKTIREKNVHFQEGSQIRKELRESIASLHVQTQSDNEMIQFLEKEIDAWKEKYYAELEHRLEIANKVLQLERQWKNSHPTYDLLAEDPE